MWGECVGMHFGGVPIREASLFPALLSGRPRVGAPGEIQVEIRGPWQEGSLVFPSQGGSPLRQLAELPPWAELPPGPFLRGKAERCPVVRDKPRPAHHACFHGGMEEGSAGLP